MMNKLIFLTIGVLTWLAPGVLSSPGGQQTAESSAELKVIAGPSLEAVGTDAAIVTWTTNKNSNSVVSYGVNRERLTISAASPNRWSRSLPYMVHRVLMVHLQPGTTYFYAVDLGNTKSAVSSFTTQSRN
jgi:hypothetical protein